MPGRGLWAAGAFGVRAITQAAALELRGHGIHVALLIVDAGIEPYAGGGRPGVDPAALADRRQVADAVAFLAEQGPRAATHELQVTPLAETWVRRLSLGHRDSGPARDRRRLDRSRRHSQPAPRGRGQAMLGRATRGRSARRGRGPCPGSGVISAAKTSLTFWLRLEFVVVRHRSLRGCRVRP
jgi:hypothetical protein